MEEPDATGTGLQKKLNEVIKNVGDDCLKTVGMTLTSIDVDEEPRF